MYSCNVGTEKNFDVSVRICIGVILKLEIDVGYLQQKLLESMLVSSNENSKCDRGLQVDRVGLLVKTKTRTKLSIQWKSLQNVLSDRATHTPEATCPTTGTDVLPSFSVWRLLRFLFRLPRSKDSRFRLPRTNKSLSNAESLLGSVCLVP